MTASGPSGFVPGTAAPSGPNYVTDADLFNFIFIAGTQNPGIAKVTHSKKHDWDKRKSPGSTGGTLTFRGSNVVEFQVEYYLWLPEHFDAWPGWAAMQRKSLKIQASGGTSGALVTAGVTIGGVAVTGGVATPATTQPVALDVYHPDLAEINVLRCIVEEEGGKQPDGKGGAKYVWKYAEYNPPKPAGGTASGSKDGMGGNPGKAAEPTAQTVADKMLAALLAKAKAL